MGARQTHFFLATCWIGFSLLLGCGGPTLQTEHGHAHSNGAHQQQQAHHRRPADIQEYLQKLDRPERDEYQQPARVIEALDLRPGMTVGDLGSGSGYFTRRFVEAVGDTGTVYAVDVEQEMLDYAKASLEGAHGTATTRFILTTPDTTGLPPNSADLIFVCNVYHHLEDRSAYFRNAKRALKPHGRVAIIDFYHDHRSGDVGFPRRHLVASRTVIDEMAKAGYTLVKEHEFLQRQYFLEFAPREF